VPFQISCVQWPVADEYEGLEKSTCAHSAAQASNAAVHDGYPSARFSPKPEPPECAKTHPEVQLAAKASSLEAASQFRGLAECLARRSLWSLRSSSRSEDEGGAVV